jgi:hypothetical protein
MKAALEPITCSRPLQLYCSTLNQSAKVIFSARVSLTQFRSIPWSLWVIAQVWHCVSDSLLWRGRMKLICYKFTCSLVLFCAFQMYPTCLFYLECLQQNLSSFLLSKLRVAYELTLWALIQWKKTVGLQCCASDLMLWNVL